MQSRFTVSLICRSPASMLIACRTHMQVHASMRGIVSLAKETDQLELGRDATGECLCRSVPQVCGCVTLMQSRLRAAKGEWLCRSAPQVWLCNLDAFTTQGCLR